MDAEKKYVRIEVKKGERVYYFYIEENSPIGEAYDAAYDVLVQLTNYAKEVVEKTKPVKEAPKEAAKEQHKEGDNLYDIMWNNDSKAPGALEVVPAEIVNEEPSNEKL